MLRLGSINDFDALYPIYMHPNVNPYLNFEILSKERFLPIFKELIESGILYVYENIDRNILATCIVCRFNRRCAHVACLTTFATNPTFHRQGIGTKFMRALIDEIKSDGQIRRIELYAEIDNENGLAFYKKNGFEVEGCLKKYYKRAQDAQPVDELVLALLLD